MVHRRKRGPIDPALPLADVLETTGLKKTTLYREMKAGRFPRPIYLTVNRPAWRASVVQQWLDSRPHDRPAA